MINQYMASNGAPQPYHQHHPSLASSRETGYISDSSNPGGVGGGFSSHQPFLSHPPRPGQPIPVKKTPDATYMSRDEVETEIF